MGAAPPCPAQCSMCGDRPPSDPAAPTRRSPTKDRRRVHIGNRTEVRILAGGAGADGHGGRPAVGVQRAVRAAAAPKRPAAGEQGGQGLGRGGERGGTVVCGADGDTPVPPAETRAGDDDLSRQIYAAPASPVDGSR
jgi:hypothetical protein